jgi:hypothetical protein
MSLFQRLRSFRLALKASGLVGHADRLRRDNRLCEALDVAQSGLALLAATGVHRDGPPEASVLITLTLLAEELGQHLGREGASERDLRDTLTLLKSLPTKRSGPRKTRDYWVPYLEARLGHEPQR